MAGIFGSSRKREYTVFGPPVNMASRLERFVGKNQILICDETYRQVQDMVQVEKMALLPIKGIERRFDVSSVIGKI
ncbi:MAG: adenylate/guanylate cyclase domain-containing protein [Syntrophales bacterium]|nr:adenylate/guanylate cyclase domain-containing protein [Syntrophales bacterium]